MIKNIYSKIYNPILFINNKNDLNKKLYCKICNLNCKTSIRLKFHSKTVFFFSYLTTKVQRKLIGINCLNLNIYIYIYIYLIKKKKGEREISN